MRYDISYEGENLSFKLYGVWLPSLLYLATLVEDFDLVMEKNVAIKSVWAKNALMMDGIWILRHKK